MAGSRTLGALFAAVALAISVVSADAAPRWVRPPAHDTVVIFMHGLWGDANGTWRSAANTSWPEMLATDDAFKNVDIYVAEYPTQRGRPGLTIPEISTLLRDPLREVFETHSRVVFVAHSMGGIIVRDLIVRYPTWTHDKVKMIYTYGTPMDGSYLARLATIVFSDKAIRQLIPGRFLDELVERWRAAELETKVISYCGYETESLVIVGAKSANRVCTYDSIAFPFTHTDLVKPTGQSDVRYAAFRSAFVRHFGRGTAAATPVAAPLPAQPAPQVATRTPEEWMNEQYARFNARLPLPPNSIGASSTCDETSKPIVLVNWSTVDSADYYIVRRNGRDVFTSTKSDYIDRDVTLGMPYSYGVQACNADGCGPSSPLSVSDHAPERCGPNTPPRCGRITQNAMSGVVPLRVRFSVAVSDDEDTPFVFWNFGDGRYIGGLTTVEHTFTSPGTYVVRANVSDQRGGIVECTASVAVTGVALEPSAADDLWFEEWRAEPGSPHIVEWPKVGPPETEFRFIAKVPERYGKAVAYRWKFNDNGSIGGEWSPWSPSPEIRHTFKTYSDVSTESVSLAVRFDDGRAVTMGGTTVVVRRRR